MIPPVRPQHLTRYRERYESESLGPGRIRTPLHPPDRPAAETRAGGPHDPGGDRPGGGADRPARGQAHPCPAQGRSGKERSGPDGRLHAAQDGGDDQPGGGPVGAGRREALRHELLRPARGGPESLHAHGGLLHPIPVGRARGSPGARAAQDDAVGAPQQREDHARRFGRARTGRVRQRGPRSALHRLRTRGRVMARSSTKTIQDLTQQDYKYGFVTDIEAETVPRGLSEEIVRAISQKKNEPEFMLEWRLKAYRHWLTMSEPTWPHVHYPAIDYQKAVYYSAPRKKGSGPKSLDEVDPKLLETYEKLGIPLRERARLAGVAVDAVVDSVSVGTTFKEQLAEKGIIFCSFTEAVQNHPDLVKKYLGMVVPYTDNYFAALNSAVFSDGSFCFIPKGVRCPMELSTYFRINAANTGQFERTL